MILEKDFEDFIKLLNKHIVAYILSTRSIDPHHIIQTIIKICCCS